MMSSESCLQLLSQWDQMIRTGHATQVRKSLSLVNIKQVPRVHLIEYAQIARRLWLGSLIIRWLQPVVRSSKPLEQPATEMELAIYARGLTMMGAFREAGEIFKNLTHPNNPQIFFFKAAWHIDQWQYKQAMAPLRKCIHKSQDQYLRVVAKVNLCACLVSVNMHEKAKKQIVDLLKKLRKRKLYLLEGNLLEIYAQLLLQNNEFDKAGEILTEAKSLLKGADNKSLFFVKKWNFIRKIKKGELPPQALRELRTEAAGNQDWESIRDCDFQMSIISNDENLIRQVYWGSRFSAYKERIEKAAKINLGSAPKFIWPSLTSFDALTKSSSPSVPRIDLVGLAPTPKLARLMFILTREFYSPLRQNEIIDFVYSTEYFHPISSPQKFHRLLGRARKWLQTSGYGVEIISHSKNRISLHLNQPMELTLYRKLSIERSIEIPLTLQRVSYFTASQWAKETGTSERTAQRHLKTLCTRGVLRSPANGKYLFLKNRKNL